MFAIKLTIFMQIREGHIVGDTNITYDEEFGINTFKRYIVQALGEEFWDKLIEGMKLPDIHTEYQCKCSNMHRFMEKFDEMADSETIKRILYKVRHGLTPANSVWAREKFLEMDDLDKFLQFHLQKELDMFIRLNVEGKDFYGQPITDEVLDFIKENPSMLAPVREGNKLLCMAFPGDMVKYLQAEDNRQKRYYACHCPFARESILAENTVSSTLCNCSLGHVMNFTEAFLDRELEGRVVSSVLGGDLVCKYEITIPDDIMDRYVR